MNNNIKEKPCTWEIVLVKIDNHYIIVNDEEIKENNWFAHFFKDGFVGVAKITEKGLLDYPKYRKNWLKLIASQNPEHNLPSITFSDEVAKELGIVDIEKLAIKESNKIVISRNGNPGKTLVEHYKNAYNQALSDNKDKLFTLEQMEAAWNDGFKCGNCLDKFRAVEPDNFIQSLTKQKWEVELETRCNVCGLLNNIHKMSCKGTTKQILNIENNSVKVIKIYDTN